MYFKDNFVVLFTSGVGTHIWKRYMCAAQSLKMGGLGSGPALKMVGEAFRATPHWKKSGILELKLTKKRIFWKGGLLEQHRSEKWNKQMYIF